MSVQDFAARARWAAVESIANSTWDRCPHLRQDEEFQLSWAVAILAGTIGGPRLSCRGVRAIACLTHPGELRCRRCTDGHERTHIHRCVLCQIEGATERVEAGSGPVAVAWLLCQGCWEDMQRARSGRKSRELGKGRLGNGTSR